MRRRDPAGGQPVRRFDRIMRMLAAGESPEAIAAAIPGVTEQDVRDYDRIRGTLWHEPEESGGAKKRKSTGRPCADDDEAVARFAALYNDNRLMSDICATMHIGNERAKRLRALAEERGLITVRHDRRPRTWLADALALRDQGWSNASIAIRLGVETAAVRRALNRYDHRKWGVDP